MGASVGSVSCGFSSVAGGSGEDVSSLCVGRGLSPLVGEATGAVSDAPGRGVSGT